jgi:uncharacterized protein (TIGR00299 family) protein
VKTLYLECTMGAAGDMLTAALLELVSDRAAALARINALGIPGVHVHADPATVCGLVGTRVDVHIHGHTEEEHHHHHHHDHEQGHEHGHHHHHASRADIAAQIASLNASDAVKAHVQAVYDLIADAEAKAHGRPVSEIHFHEVGMADALSDIAAVALLLEELGPVRVVASRPEVGGGFVQCAHGTLPVPAPATANILTGVPYTSGAANCELLTPTGAALLVHFADAFGPMPPLAVERTGLGLGHREVPGRLNGVRAFLGENTGGTHCCASELGGTRSCASATGPNGRVVELRANIDDMTGEDLAFACDRLRAAGALDVSLAPLAMKKGRPGHLLIVLAPPEQADALAAAILRETSTFGVRRVDCARYELDREIVPGDVRVKVGHGYGVEKSKPEFADRTKH